MTLYELNQLCLEPMMVYTMCGNEKICIFSQIGHDMDLPEIFEECHIQEIWCENGLIAVRI